MDIKPRVKASENFYADEFICKCGKCGKTVKKELIDLLQKVRRQYNKPMIISSAARCFEHNKSVGGAEQSSHLDGTAVDILVDNSADRYELISLLYHNGFKGIGVGRNFVHADIRDTKAVFWHYYKIDDGDSFKLNN